MIFWESYGNIWKVENKGKWSSVNFSTSRKDRDNEGKAVFSNWSFVGFVGKAHEKVQGMGDGTRVLLKGTVSKEPYIDKDGQTAYPKNPQFKVYDLEVQEESGGRSFDTPPRVVESTTEDNEEDFPF